MAKAKVVRIDISPTYGVAKSGTRKRSIVFSICFGQNDGYFSIGEIDKSYHKTEIEYVPIIKGETNFYININKIKVGNKDINIQHYRGFIDSGTTISYFPNEIYNSIVNEFNSISL